MWNGMNVTLGCCTIASRVGNYSGVKRFDEMGVEAKEVKQGQDYSESEENRVRS